MEVKCLHGDCDQVFRIIGDSVEPSYSMLLAGCYELMGLKRYMNCVLTVAQAYEVFFSLYFRVELLYKPYAGTPKGGNLSRLNEVAERLTTKTKDDGFEKMRSAFLTHIVSGVSPGTLDDSERVIDAFPPRPQEPPDSAIRSLSDPKISQLLLEVKKAKIATLRNNVVHKTAYRPTKDEAKNALEEGMNLLLPLGSLLDLQDDVNWYCRKQFGR